MEQLPYSTLVPGEVALRLTSPELEYSMVAVPITSTSPPYKLNPSGADPEPPLPGGGGHY